MDENEMDYFTNIATMYLSLIPLSTPYSKICNNSFIKSILESNPSNLTSQILVSLKDPIVYIKKGLSTLETSGFLR